MGNKRIRQINVLELDQAMYDSTYEVGLELSNWLNAPMHVCMLESQEQKQFVRQVYGQDDDKSHTINKNQIESIINGVRNKGGLFDLGFSMEHFDEDDSVNDIFKELSLDESLSVLGYNKSEKHKDVLKKLLKYDLGNPLMLVPMGESLKNFHRIIVPFQPEYVTKSKLKKLKWYADQLGVMVDFVHFDESIDKSKKAKEQLYDTIYSWVNELKFNSEVKFRFPIADNLNLGLKDYLRDQENYLLCIIDSHIKGRISTSKQNSECLMDIKETVVIL